MKRELSPRKLASRLECAVDWPRKFVGVRFLFTKKEFEEARGVELTRPINYCMMVKSATLGHAVKGDASAHRCVAAARALGIAEMDEMHRSGRRGLCTQLYHDLGTAKDTAHTLGVNPGIDPFMTLSFMALPVIPTLRITTRGVFDVTQQIYV